MSNPSDLTGMKFNYLTAIKKVTSKPRSRWLCMCDCGTHHEVDISNLTTSNVKSCGCHRRKVSRERQTTHGLAKSKIHNIWLAIKSRTGDKNNPRYSSYGGRGIHLFKMWRDSFDEFYAYVGEPPFEEASIDRIDNEQGYFPGNVRWADRKQQANNKRNNHFLCINGDKKTIAQWSEISGISSATIRWRIKTGASHEEAVFRPSRQKRD